MDDARLLVAHSVCEWVSGVWWRRRRCSILGPCRRVCGRCGAGEVVCTVGLHRGPSGAELAAAQADAGLLISPRTTLSAPSHHQLSFALQFFRGFTQRHTRSFRYLSPTPLSVELHFFTRYRWPVWTKCVRYMMPLLLTFRMVCLLPWAAVWNR